MLMLKLLSRVGLLKYVNLKTNLSVGGTTIKLPIIAGMGYENLYPSEMWLKRILPVLMSIKGGTFVDVGANVGQTLLKFIACADGRDYFGFEPNPICAHYVDTIRRVNGLTGVRIIPVALGDKNMVTELYLNVDHDPCASIVDGFRKSDFYSSKKYITVLKGDELFQRLCINSVGILKIDVEGGELEVLQGLYSVVTKLRPFILCEILPIGDVTSDIGRMRRRRTDDIMEYISSANYKILRLLHDGAIVVVKNIITHADLALCEYLFVPDELFERLCVLLEIVSASA